MPGFINSVFQRFFPKISEAGLISQWFFITRVIGAIAIALGIVFLWMFNAIDFAPGPILFGLIPIYFIVNFLWLFGTKIKTRGWAFLYLQMIVDTLMITAGIYLSGGIHSELVYLYLMVILSAAVISFRAIVAMGFAALALYMALIFTEQLELIAPAQGSHWGFHADEAVRIGVYSIIVIIVAFQSYFYISRIRKKDEELIKLKDEFLFRTVHGLRSPSAAIRWILEKWSSPKIAARYPEMREDMTMIRQLNEKMLTLIQDLLNWAHGKETVFKQERFAVTGLIQNLLKEFDNAVREKTLVVEYTPKEDLPMVLADRERTKEVFNNLIDNAIKYNKTGGSIAITHETDGDFLKTTLRDTGAGIQAENIPKLFTPYFRADGKGIVGTGLGLYIVKTLVEKMGGSISAESSPGQGAAFHIFLPIATK